jgi:hypothetical protein
MEKKTRGLPPFELARDIFGIFVGGGDDDDDDDKALHF